MPRNYTPIPDEYAEEMASLTDAQFGRLVRACIRYNRTGVFPELRNPENFFRVRCKNRIDSFNDSYDELARKRSEAGRKGAAARWGLLPADGTAAGEQTAGPERPNSGDTAEPRPAGETPLPSLRAGPAARTEPGAPLPPNVPQEPIYALDLYLKKHGMAAP